MRYCKDGLTIKDKFVKLYLNLYKLRTCEYIVSLTKTFALEGCLNSRLFENQTFYLTYPIDFPLKISLTRKYRPLLPSSALDQTSVWAELVICPPMHPATQTSLNLTFLSYS